MFKKTLIFPAILGSALLAAACGSDSNNDGGGGGGGNNRVVTVTGNAAVFPPAVAVLTQAAGGTAYSADLSGLQITLASAARELAGSTQYLGGPVNLTSAGAGSNAATWSVPSVNLDDVGIALIAHIEDPNGTVQAANHRITTGVLLAADIPATNAPNPLHVGDPDAGAPAFVVPDAFETALAASLGTDKATLVAGGYILGMIVQGSSAVSGATVAVSGGTGTVAYPFGGSDTTGTGPTGVFVVTGAETALPLTLTASKTGVTFSQAQAGIKPTITFIAPITAQ